MKFLEEICSQIVNPPKIRYSTYDLGCMLSTNGRRNDFRIINKKGHKLHVSFYESNKKSNEKICVVYLHSMNGSRLQSTIYAEDVLNLGYSFCNFDFSGCGNSEGQTISFGANEKYDIDDVINTLKEKFHVSKFILWGRSMGSASAIKYCELIQNNQGPNQPKQILGLVLDSCFRSFDKLAIEIANKSSSIPQFLIKIGYFIIKGSLQEKGQFKVSQLQLEQVVSKLYLPILFLASPEDLTVCIEHSQSLFKACQHPGKKLYYIKGLHNESRDDNYLSEVKNYIENIVFDYRNAKTLKEVPSDSRFNRFQMMAFHKRNFTFQSEEWSGSTDQCSCSLFPEPVKQNAFNHDYLPTTGRNQSEQVFQRKIVKKMSRSSSKQFNFRSSEKLLPLSSNKLQYN